ncbi:bacillithiol system redox-active protein YtxJ [Thalassorhabdus alkalitolerans]|uniref:Bacillithiol system redox-active protein YtxJ n=1 Tax=Thalassorhabdus alkalitolerans TaxID=2282697 RepID=A0ABW0YMY4_9BACI
MSLVKLNEVEEFDNALSNEEKVLIFKNSVTCSISEAAFKELEAFTKDHPESRFFYLNVQDARPLSDYIAETFDVKHESPQALIIRRNNVVWHDSHWRVTSQMLDQKWEEA